jgi:DNA-binding beta-propeller fold protein YncE
MNLRDHSIQHVDPQTNQAEEPVSVYPFDEMIGAGENLLLAAPSRSEVALFDPQTSEVGTSIPVKGEFRGMAFDPESNTLWVGSATDGTLTHIDAATGRVLDTFTVDGLPSGGVIVSTGNDELWVATFDAEILKVDLAQRSVVTRLQPFGPKPVEVSLVTAGGHLWATSVQRPTLLRIDSRTGTIDRRGSIDASGNAFPRLSAPPDGTLWVAVAPDRIEELDAETGQTLKSYEIPMADDANPNDYYNAGGIITGFGSVWTTIFNDKSFVDDALVRIRR